MGKTFRIVIALVLLLTILLFMCTFTVRYTETAVLTTFGQASEGSVKSEPGLYFKLPPPFQRVDKYDTRQRLVETRSETLATADNRQIIVQSFVVWRISDALKFYQAYSNAGAREEDHLKAAEDALRAKLRSALSETSGYRLSELLSTDNAGTAGKLGELEGRVLTAIGTQGGAPGTATGAGASGALAAAGLSAVTVGIHSIELPESITETIYKSMEAERKRIAGAAASAGEAAAAQVRSSADDDASRIRAFAMRRADAIRAQGDLETAKYLGEQAKNTDLAVFLQNMRLLREAFSKRTTLVLPTSLPGLHLLDPSRARELGDGVIPPMPSGAKPQGERTERTGGGGR
jgi:membrane protease subunit HflC